MKIMKQISVQFKNNSLQIECRINNQWLGVYTNLVDAAKHVAEVLKLDAPNEYSTSDQMLDDLIQAQMSKGQGKQK